MKTILFLFAVLIFGLVSCNNTSSNRGVEINGVRWATSNVETLGTFARNPESAGGLFTFDEAQNACPRGWRLPTADELRSLRDAVGGGWTVRNGVNGRTFGTTPNQMFVPAVGDALGGAGNSGLFWGSTTSGADFGWYLWFTSTTSSVNTIERLRGLSVRCVSSE